MLVLCAVMNEQKYVYTQFASHAVTHVEKTANKQNISTSGVLL